MTTREEGLIWLDLMLANPPLPKKVKGLLNSELYIIYMAREQTWNLYAAAGCPRDKLNKVWAQIQQAREIYETASLSEMTVPPVKLSTTPKKNKKK